MFAIAAIDATLIVDDTDVVVEVNAAATVLTGRTADALIGAPIASLVRGLENVETLYDAEEPTPVDAFVLLAGGEVAVHAWRRRISSGRVAVILRDATEWIASQSTLQIVVAGVEHSDDAFEITDGDGNIEYANDAHTRIVGMSLFDVMGTHITKFIDGDDVERVDAALKSGVPWRGEVSCHLSDGLEHHHDLSLTPVTDAFTGTRRFVVIRRDITARVVAQREMDSLRERLVHADRLAVLGQLAASVAHDVNNPATFIFANLRLVLDDLLSWQAEDARPQHQERTTALIEMVRDALDGTERVVGLVRGMRALSTRSAPVRERVVLAEIARDAIRLTRSQTSARARVIESLDTAIVHGDRLRLGQVAVNLLVNAAQAIPHGVEGHHITVTTRSDGKFAELSVADTGVGIPTEHLERVFEAWFTTKNREEGTGLGLAVSAQIVSDLGGTLRATHGVERGTVFTIRLPALAT